MNVNNPDTFLVQDGFELNLNIGIKCKKHLDSFFGLIKASHEKCLELKDVKFSTLLIKLFSELKLPEADTKNEAKARKKFTMTIHSVAGDLKLCQDILSIQNKDKIYSVEDQQLFFFNHVFDNTVKFLKEIYLCTVVPEVTDAPQNPFNKEFKLMLCVDTVNGRKKMNFKDDSSMKAEIDLSRKMNEKKVRLDLDISFKISSRDKGKTVDFDMLDSQVGKKSALLTFGNFFAVNIQPAVKYFLKKRWEEVTNNVTEN